MNKRIVIKIGAGSLIDGYTATVQIGEEGLPPQVEVPARLPPAPDVPELYRRWQQAYWQLGLPYRLEAQNGVTNVSDVSDIVQCRVMSTQLRDRLHYWLNGEDFRPIREKVLEQLSPQDTVRVMLQTQDLLLQRLPWYDLHMFQRYRNAEVGICLPCYQQVSYRGSRSEKVRVLAVLGEATGLDTQMDCTLLGQLPDADVHFLKAPSVEAFNESLWDEQGWDILFFAGHSKSRVNCVANALAAGEPSSQAIGGLDGSSDSDAVTTEGNGELQLNATETLTVPQLKHALSKAIDRGLNTAIFNSCDGLGLAADLADLYIPQVLVMREPVPDKVAHAFLQGFLASFSAGTSFYLAVREAREKLQGLEARFPCATWLPVIVQNLAETPPTWRSLQGKSTESGKCGPAIGAGGAGGAPVQVRSEAELAANVRLSSVNTLAGTVGKFRDARKPDLQLAERLRGWKVAVAAGLSCAAVVLGGRFLGGLEVLELKAYDYFLRSRPPESLDERILIITNTEADISARPNTTSNRSVSDETLSDVLARLDELNPQMVGLDIYLEGAVKMPLLARQLAETDNLIAICKAADYTTQTSAKPPPLDVTDAGRIAASDFVADGGDRVVRRHLLAFMPPPDSACQSGTGLGLLMANRYLAEVHGIFPSEEVKIGETALPVLRGSLLGGSFFGGYHNVDAAGSQALLNYRILDEPSQTNCGEVRETPADCIDVSTFLTGAVDDLRSHVENKIVLIGTTAAGYDPHITPYTRTASVDRQVPGVFIQAQMISQLVSAGLGERSFIGSWLEWQEAMWIVGWALLGGVLGLSVGLQKFWLRLLLAEGLLVVACWLLLVGGSVWVPWVPSAIALPAAALSTRGVVRSRSKYRIGSGVNGSDISKY